MSIGENVAAKNQVENRSAYTTPQDCRSFSLSPIQCTGRDKPPTFHCVGNSNISHQAFLSIQNSKKIEAP